MKKVIWVFSFMLLSAIGCFGQLQVSSNGKVDVSRLEAGSIISNNLVVSDNISINGKTHLNYGLNVTGVTGEIGGGVIRVSSQLTPPDWNLSKGILCSLISSQSLPSQCGFANYYNGAANFYVNYDGSIHTKYGLIQISDSICKKDVTPLSSTLNKLHALNGVSFNYKEEEANLETDSIATYSNFSNDNIQMSDIQRQIESEKSRKRIGLIAQDVEKIYPEVVRTQYDGTKGIMYSDLVAILIEGIKELSTQVETLQQQVDLLQNKENTPTPKQNGGSKKSSKIAQAILYQNAPNPFNQETEIAYRIPDRVTASICIYNLNGQQLKEYPLTDTDGKIIISASEFPTGIYTYSLIINGQIIDTKRIVLTN